MTTTNNNTADTQVQDAANEWWNLIGWTARRSLGRKYHPGLDLTKLLDNEILSIYLKETSLPSTKAQKNITPSDFTVCPMGSVCQKSEAEPIAANIMVILKRTGNIFRKLTWEEYKDERLKDTGLSSDEASYFNMVIDYCTDAKSASLFSPVWKEIYDKETPEPSTKEEAEGIGEFTKGEWAVRDYEVIGPFGSNKSICEMTGDFMSKAEKKANALRIVTCVNGWDELRQHHAENAVKLTAYQIKCERLEADNEKLGKGLSEMMSAAIKERDYKNSLLSALKELVRYSELLAWDGAISLDASIDRAKKALNNIK